MSAVIQVAVAVVVDQQNKVCISRRHQSSHQGGLWEFPGGKVEPGETINQALVREIREELGLEIHQSRNLIQIQHEYTDRRVCLHVCRVISYSGKASSVEGQPVRWVPIEQLSNYEFPAANLPIIKSLQLPARYLITGKFEDTSDFTRRLQQAIKNGIRLIQLRLKDDSLLDKNDAQKLLEIAASMCQQANAKLMLNLSSTFRDIVDLRGIEYDGLHADSRTLSEMNLDVESKPDAGKLFSASCHNPVELEKAMQLNADFLVLSPVQKTTSHPDMDAMGWDSFAEMIKAVPIPVYALGGVNEQDIERVWLHGGQGIAAISAFWS